MRSFWLCLLLAVCLGFGVARAQPEDPAPASPQLTAPVLEHFVEADTPAEASAVNADVSLILAVDAQGQVTEVVVESSGAPALEAAARTAATQLRFQPATRNGQPVPARIRFRYAFRAAEAAVDAAAPTTGELFGTINDQTNERALVGADVSLTGPDGAPHSALTDAEGRFAFRGLPPGNYQLRISALDHVSSSALESISAGQRTEGVYRLAAAAAAPGSEFGAVARVEAPEREVVRRSIPREDLIHMAGTRGDALRTVELLPGVARPPAGLGMVLIRGSAPGDSEVFMDGAPIYNLYHFGGLTSVANGFLLRGIDLYPGNFSVRYGRKTGGVIDTGFRDPKDDRLHALLDVNMIDASVLVEAPLGKRVSFAIAGRRSYLDAWLGRVMASSGLEVLAAPVYYDYQSILSFRASHDKLRATFYGSYDELTLLMKQASEQDPSLHGRFGNMNSFHRGQLEWHHDYSSKVDSDITLAAGPLRFRQAMGPSLAFDAQGFDFIARAEWHVRLLPRLRLNAGLDSQFVHADLQYHGPKAQQTEGDPSAMGPLAGRELGGFDQSADFVRPAAYAELVAMATDRIELKGGARVDYFADIHAVAVDPRVNARLLLGSTTLRSGVGLFSQPPDYAQTIKGYGNPDLKPLRALHVGAGVDQRIGEHANLSLDGFYKHLTQLIVNAPDGAGLENRGVGRIYGLELMGRIQPVGRFSGFVAYTLSRSERNDMNGKGYRLFDYDQTHVLSCSGNLKLGKGWLLGSTFRFASGNPYTPIVGSIYDANQDVYQPRYGATNTARNTSFNRLDVRVEKKWVLGAGSLTAYLDIQNIYNRQNREGTSYNYDYARQKNLPGLPIIPSLGLRGEL